MTLEELVAVLTRVFITMFRRRRVSGQQFFVGQMVMVGPTTGMNGWMHGWMDKWMDE